MAFDVTGRVALITGSGRGLGRAIAIRLAGAGASCGLTSRTSEELKSVAAAIEADGGRATVYECDVSVRDQVESCVEHVETRLGPVDVLINNAGVGYQGPIEEMDDADWHHVIQTNLTSVLYFSRRVIPGMKDRGWGRIINIASISGQTGGLNSGANYAASKGGMIAMTKKMARELAPFGVTVNAVSPGQIETEMGSRLSPQELERVRGLIPIGRLGIPDDVAYAVLFLASAEAGYVAGETLSVNGGILMD